jgi:Ca2+-binding EF-hand superfamily protein
MVDGLIEKYDVNKDGQLDATELAAMRQAAGGEGFMPHGPCGPRGGERGPAHLPKEIIDQYDADKDGKLSNEERTVLHQDIKDGKVAPPMPPRPPRPQGPPHAATTAQLLEKFDANKDGVLDESELASFLSQARPHRPPGPPDAPMAPEPPPAHQ